MKELITVIIFNFNQFLILKNCSLLDLALSGVKWLRSKTDGRRLKSYYIALLEVILLYNVAQLVNGLRQWALSITQAYMPLLRNGGIFHWWNWSWTEFFKGQVPTRMEFFRVETIHDPSQDFKEYRKVNARLRYILTCLHANDMTRLLCGCVHKNN